MKQKISLVVIGFLLFIIGNLFPYDFSNIQSLFLKIKICNNTNINIKNIYINNFFLEGVDKKSCSPYIGINKLKKTFSINIFTLENEKIFSYKITPIDLNGVKNILFGKYTIDINKLIKSDNFIIEYNKSIDYKIKKEVF